MPATCNVAFTVVKSCCIGEDVVSFVNIDVIRLNELEAVAVEVLDIEAGGSVRQGGDGGDVILLGRERLVAGGNVAAVEFGGEDTEVAR